MTGRSVGSSAPTLTLPHLRRGRELRHASPKALPREVGESWVGAQRDHSTIYEKAPQCPA
ncbi:hypothetical protein M2351_001422 [Azospirillum canadense]|nr:hypothetical protein [Azospirillum canadense]